MELTEKDVIEILKLFEHSKFDYLHLEEGGRKITVSKGGFAPNSINETSAVTVSPPAPIVRPAPSPHQTATESVAVDPALFSVTAPMIGTFYIAPSPSDPPFVQVGQRVAPGGTMGLIEVMKVFASVVADVGGVVERIMVANGQSVEQGQILFLIRAE